MPTKRDGSSCFSATVRREPHCAKTALVLPAGQAWREMIEELALRQPECLCRHQHGGSEPAARNALAIAAVALEHHDRFSRAFVANRPARASAGKRYLHRVHWDVSFILVSFLGVQFQRASSFEQALEAAQDSRPAFFDAQIHFAARREFVMRDGQFERPGSMGVRAFGTFDFKNYSRRWFVPVDNVESVGKQARSLAFENLAVPF
jgi:hypothetical protein